MKMINLIHQKTTILICLLFFSYQVFSTGNDKPIKTVVIDAGHGGDDHGCLGSNSKEKYIALDIAQRLGEMIEKQSPGVKVIYTRKADEFLSINDRAAIANQNNADLFISIHMNENSNKAIFGTETYILGRSKQEDYLDVIMRENKVIMLENKVRENYQGFDPESQESISKISQPTDTAIYEASKLFATKIEDQFSNSAKRTSRGVKQGGLLILSKVSMPSVVIFPGYLSNLNEESFLKTSTGKDEITSAIYRAFKDYKDEIDNKRKLALEKKIQEEELAKQIADSLAAAKIAEEEKLKAELEAKKEPEVIFKVQISSGTKKLEQLDSKFDTFDDLEAEPVGNGTYRYVTGSFTDIDEALSEQKRIRAKTVFKSAFVVAYRKGKRVPIKEFLPSH